MSRGKKYEAAQPDWADVRTAVGAFAQGRWVELDVKLLSPQGRPVSYVEATLWEGRGDFAPWQVGSEREPLNSARPETAPAAFLRAIHRLYARYHEGRPGEGERLARWEESVARFEGRLKA